MDDYSFAIEYDGPPLPYTIPRAIPLDLSHIPMASPAPPSSTSSVPVVHPLPSPLLHSKPPTSTFSPTSVIETGAVMDRSAELTEDAVETSGPVSQSHHVSTESNSEFDFKSRSSGSDQEEEEEEEEEDDEDFMDGHGVGSLPHHSSRHLVTFSDPTYSPGFETPAPRMCGKKGTCYHCGKGSRFTEKEACLACGAKYCADCLIRAMGSMPEGRKCVACIGRPILESKREKIGKSSKVLKKLLSSREVEQVMRAEKCCEANRLRPEDVFVNGKKLNLDELSLLQSCPCPPPKLKPGYYWYDKVSGYWGKNGHKPSKIITPNLNVGGNLEKNASNGNTGICINGREITKSELQMLKLAGVQCAGKPQFWVNSDGSYQEEGQKKIIGRIWGKPLVKLICPVLSLPTPTGAQHAHPSDKEYVESARRVMSDYIENKPTQKILLVGCEGSGTSTILKQAKILYGNTSFTEEEREEMKIMIQTNVYRYLAMLLEAREIFEEEIMYENTQTNQLPSSDADKQADVSEYSLGPRLRSFADWLLKVMASGSLEVVFPAATREYAPRVEELWKDPAIQATYRRKDELQMLPSCASYFLEKAGEVCRMDYEPNNADILNAAGLTSSNGVACTDFTFPRLPYDTRAAEDLDQQESSLKYELIRIHSKGLDKNVKWLDMFEEARIVVFCVATSDYDEFYETPDGVQINKMLESRDLFEKIITSDTFAETSFLLILNKIDLLEKKIEHSPLTACDWFSDFHPLISRYRANYSSRHLGNHSTLSQTASHYIAVKYKRLFSSLVGRSGRRLFVTCTSALDSSSVDSALRYAKEVLRWDDEKPVFEVDSFYDITEHSTYSH
ncbi:Guanine nucleotide-binding protein subunit alpha [Rhynchospora pubera]|uniref:Guanine nucleotide-binding protein subunit alpha n=1 Tax=Rhynchospora pubera TaxID=906938 RepID=A0AAV8EPD9_9POAL|nr:Guanine nucleotide-binding protein subunit alpha [Rhynchospora pubera]